MNEIYSEKNFINSVLEKSGFESPFVFGAFAEGVFNEYTASVRLFYTEYSKFFAFFLTCHEI